MNTVLTGFPIPSPIVPKALGKEETTRKSNLTAMMDGYFGQNAHHLNVNVFDRQQLIDAMESPGKLSTTDYTVSGYAVNFIKFDS